MYSVVEDVPVGECSKPIWNKHVYSAFLLAGLVDLDSFFVSVVCSFALEGLRLDARRENQK